MYQSIFQAYVPYTFFLSYTYFFHLPFLCFHPLKRNLSLFVFKKAENFFKFSASSIWVSILLINFYVLIQQLCSPAESFFRHPIDHLINIFIETDIFLFHVRLQVQLPYYQATILSAQMLLLILTQ